MLIRTHKHMYSVRPLLTQLKCTVKNSHTVDVWLFSTVWSTVVWVICRSPYWPDNSMRRAQVSRSRREVLDFSWRRQLSFGTKSVCNYANSLYKRINVSKKLCSKFNWFENITWLLWLQKYLNLMSRCNNSYFIVQFSQFSIVRVHMV